MCRPLVRCGGDRGDATGLAGVRFPRPAGMCSSAGAHSRGYCGHKSGRQATAHKERPGSAWVPPEGTVPLSEHEQRQLEQIEQALRAGDPRFADAVHAADPRVHYKRRVIAAAAGFVIGTGLLLAGVVINVIPVAVAGFVVMLACSLWAVTSYRRMTGITTGRTPTQARRPGNKRRAAKGRQAGQAGSGLMGRLEERWRRRQERDR
jgi:hypothetical protein